MQDLTVSDSLPTPANMLTARQTLDRLRAELLDQRLAAGHWVGELSPSSLSTATAVSAIASVLLNQSAADQRNSAGRQGHSNSTTCWHDRIRRGMDYLRRQQNHDGGYGDTDRSHSNIATSYLVLAASALALRAAGEGLPQEQLGRLNAYLLDAGELDALRQRYGTDKTFVVPILTNLAIAGLVPWEKVPRLPFEAAVFPQSMYRLLQMPVVSYAIPALVAIGQARHFCGPQAWLPIRMIRGASVSRTMDVLRRMQPQSGGYLEATPLTSFVVMSLAVTGRTNNQVCDQGLKFLDQSMSEEGSWPIDTNLATWVTSLAMEALASDPQDDGSWCDDALIDWHLGCQHRQRHPFTGAEPGGWGWSDLSGAVPDSDDTPAAILALKDAINWVENTKREQMEEAIAAGVGWLQRLQNRDGGWPTFCRGWGRLPFDRSSNDLTAHAIRALSVASAKSEFRASPTGRRAVRFLLKQQQDDGSWFPLWFGNQDRKDESNPVYGTAKVLATVKTGVLPQSAVDRGLQYLIRHQNADGGWGGGPSVAAWWDDREAFPGWEGSETGADDSGASTEDGKVEARRFGSRDGVSKSRAGKSLQSSGRAWISSVEETALAVDALVSVALARNRVSSDQGGGGPADRKQSVDLANKTAADHKNERSGDSSSGVGETSTVEQTHREAIIRGVEWLLRSVAQDRHREPWPIGFYFAKLWYHEKLYPLIFTVSALGKYNSLVTGQPDACWPR
ncbi:MAG: prenyltransferase/squalene oxidase repeat-containing protein [Planctomycetota bacterium]|nr:prenyltransferase/squalene oxidase repeat-containing protein [Planctomycetota bacterium]